MKLSQAVVTFQKNGFVRGKERKGFFFNKYLHFWMLNSTLALEVCTYLAYNYFYNAETSFQGWDWSYSNFCNADAEYVYVLPPTYFHSFELSFIQPCLYVYL